MTQEIVDGLYETVITALRCTKNAKGMFGKTFSRGMATNLIKNYKLKFEKWIAGIKEAHFEYRDEIYRLEERNGVSYRLYFGRWTPDPHWSGD